MKKIWCLIITCVLFLNVSAQTDSTKIYSAHLFGKVTHAEKYVDSANSIRFIVNNILTDKQESYVGKIKADGTFSVDIPKINTQGIFFIFNRSYVPIIIAPKTQLEIKFDADKPEQTLYFTGDYAHANQDLSDYIKAQESFYHVFYSSDRFDRSRQLSKSEKENAPEAHKQFVLERYNKEKAFTDQYIIQHKPSATFVSWATNDLKYECADNLMRYTWMHALSNHIKTNAFYPDSTYFDFFKEFPVNAPEAMISSNYNSYLHEYSTYLKKSLGKSYESHAPFALFKTQAPFIRELLACHAAYNYIESKSFDAFAYIKDDFLSAVSNPQYKNYILSAYQKGVEFRENAKIPHDALINKVPQTEGDSIFNKILAKYPNKVIYVDFWATWCGPCRAEMPNSKALQEKLKGKDVVFVYLGVQSDEKTWKSQIAEMGITGEHYLLKQNEYNAISGKFKISSIPRYILINRKGNIFDDTAKRPGDQKLKTEIEELLAEN